MEKCNHICDYSCHTDDGLTHIMPYCIPCATCGENVKDEYLHPDEYSLGKGNHYKECHNGIYVKLSRPKMTKEEFFEQLKKLNDVENKF